MNSMIISGSRSMITSVPSTVSSKTLTTVPSMLTFVPFTLRKVLSILSLHMTSCRSTVSLLQ